jgi:hypothetical protein
MKKSITLTLAGIVAIGAMSFDILTSNGKAGKTGAYTEGNCTSCHSDYAVNSGPGSIAITSTPSLTNGYVAGTTYTVNVTVAQSGVSLFGFDFEALTNATTNGGTLAVVCTDTKTLASSSRTDVVHTGTGNATADSHTFSFVWTAPTTGTSTVTFYASGNAADGDGSTSGDYIYTTSLPISNVTSVEENVEANFNLSVFPNPVSDNVNVKFTLMETSDITIDLMDINGNKIANIISENGMKGDINKTFNVSSYSKGVYFLQIKNEKASSIKKLIIK